MKQYHDLLRRILKNGEFGIHPTLILTNGDGRLTRFTNELMVNINLKIFEILKFMKKRDLN